VQREGFVVDCTFYETNGSEEGSLESLRSLFGGLKAPFTGGESVGVKLHWGERGNQSFLPPIYAREIVQWLYGRGAKPFVFDTTVLYSGGRRRGKDTLATAAEHGYTEQFLGCPVVVADGMDGRDVTDIPAGFSHFDSIQVASVVEKAQGFVIFSHFTGHMEAGFGGAIKNISMGLASRAQKQRMHSDARPVLKKKKCTKCGVCAEVCPTGAAQLIEGEYPTYDLEKCIGCAQCIAMCPELALRILWGTDPGVFQEKLVETAAAVWQHIEGKTVFINALLNITVDCDCLPGKAEVMASDQGFLAGQHPVAIDAESIKRVGPELFTTAHPSVPWRRQFEYAREIGFYTAKAGI
jgi:uncharacterized Fe-S center protein